MHPIVTSACLAASRIFLILPLPAHLKRVVDPEPELRVRHRRSCGRAMDLLERCVTRDPNGSVAAAAPARSPVAMAWSAYRNIP